MEPRSCPGYFTQAGHPESPCIFRTFRNQIPSQVLSFFPHPGAPAFAMGTISQLMVHSTAVLYQSAVNAQNQQNILGQAAATQGIMQIYSSDTGTDGVGCCPHFKG
ncbi:hypothetical protein FY557_11875 [Chryseobacterium sp. SN22]|uniref:RebB family R body protein n=1 Tax=Chryseobacterium sp. SN22 TaxID=2606431 RepID=UPI0011ED8DE9|nr:RebB family R body protein [Chryseobacterium sp. SN22]KAA0127851.1 hypothetical protein FY557_11875 [Chryseobacterium sp. SN22]